MGGHDGVRAEKMHSFSGAMQSRQAQKAVVTGVPTNQKTREVVPDERCVVCAKTIRPAEDHVTLHLGGKDYLTCCPSCAQRFEAMPAVFTLT